ncbi:metallophosphoesterase [Pseudomonas sp. KnCO4]|uniref:metallophosphoesterase n=1 Tax=Pseudomonas sp. KnCO4 TaxID=3381355 RepID=UPI003877C7EF
MIDHHSPLRFFPANNRGRDFIIGDIHGQFDIFETILEKINFNDATDRFFATGDIVDRGPYSDQAVDWLTQPWFNSVRGNHEQMIIDAMSGKGDPARHARNGGSWFYQLPLERQHEIAIHLKALPFAIELELLSGEKIGIIHAEPPGLEASLSWQKRIKRLSAFNPTVREKAQNQALYSRARIENSQKQIIEGVTQVYVGHTTVREVMSIGNITYLDTGCSFPDGKLSVIDLHTKLVVSCGAESSS